MAKVNTTTPTGRPPADELLNEFIFDKKCGQGENFTKFFNWCRSGEGWVDTTCFGVSGSSTPCVVYFSFDVADGFKYDRCEKRPRGIAYEEILYQEVQNVTGTPQPMVNESSSLRPEFNEPGDPTVIPRNVYYNKSCSLGKPCSGKDEIQSSIVPLTEERALEIKQFCEYQINPVIGMPWWLIVLIVLLTIAAVAGAFTLFWKYWLRRRIYGRQRGDRSSLGSEFTSAPISSALGVTSNKPSNLAAQSGQSGQSGIRVFHVPSIASGNMRSSRQSSRKPASMSSNSMRSNIPSTRSSLSRSRSRSLPRSKNSSAKPKLSLIDRSLKQ